MTDSSQQLIDHLFRTEYGKLVAMLTGIFGPAHIELAEDIVQDSLITALHHWSVDGIPKNPTAWLFQVARRKVLNELKRKQMLRAHHQSGLLDYRGTDLEKDVFLDNEIQDSQLRMIFTCCHPALTTSSQIALTLKTLCGFGVKELASALLTKESAINKRLYRSKEIIRKEQTLFKIPQGLALQGRLENVALTLYLLFNEGYNSSTGNQVIQKDMCLEAMRLTKLLVDRFDTHKALKALLSLMCFHVARFDARIDDRGAIVLFEDQQRDLWNRDLIMKGMYYLKHALHDKSLSAYHIEAYIAAEHCLAPSFEQTNWQRIYDHYQLLKQIKNNPLIDLNLAIIQSQLNGETYALNLLEAMADHKVLKSYYLLPATQASFYMKLKQVKEAIVFFEKALSLKPPEGISKLIQKQIKQLKTEL